MRLGGFFEAFDKLCYSRKQKAKINFLELELKQEQERVLSKITDLVVENYNETLQRASWRTYEKAARMLKKAGL